MTLPSMNKLIFIHKTKEAKEATRTALHFSGRKEGENTCEIFSSQVNAKSHQTLSESLSYWFMGAQALW